jgi:membrane-bound lytic murein transglycosylase B
MRFLAALLLLLAAAQPALGQSGYAQRPEVRAFVHDLVEKHGFVETELVTLFARVRRAEPVLQAIQPQPPKARSWEEFRATFVNEQRIGAGSQFWAANRSALERAQRDFGVPAHYIAAIIGVETFYGRNSGRWRVVDALSTLAFDYPPRADYFRDELVNYLLMVRDSGVDVFSVRGSYAGAIGIPQFMPGSVRRFAVDFDGDGTIDLQRNAADAIGSVANFLKQHGWQAGGAVSLPARVNGEAYRRYADGSVDPKYPIADLVRAGVEPQALPEALSASRAALIELATPERPSEFRLGLQNFYVITRYNRSAFYASAVHDLAAELKKAQEAGR